MTTRRALLLAVVLASCSSGPALPPIASEPAPKGPTIAGSLCLAGVAHRESLQPAGHFDAELARFQDLGASWIRYDVDWVDVEKTPGVYELDWLDAMLKKLEAARVKSIPMLGYGNPLYNPESNGDRFYPPTTPAPFAAYARAIAARFGTRLGPYEIWNEPNSGWRFFKPKTDPDYYAELLDAASVAIHDACPQCRTLFGGVFWHPEAIMGGDDFIEAATAAKPEIWQHLDGLAVHPYAFYPPTAAPDSDQPPDVPMPTMLAGALAATGLGTPPPLWITEVGWPIQAGALDEDGQAANLVKAYALANRAGAEAVCWYDLQDGPNHGTFPPEDDFGLLQYSPNGPTDGQPKRAYRSFQALARVVGDVAFSRDRGRELGLAKDGDAALLYRNESGTRAVTILWSTLATLNETVKVPLHRDAQAELYDDAGALLPLTISNGAALVPVDETPRLLVEQLSKRK